MKHNFSNTKGYLNTAGAGLISKPSANAGIEFIQDIQNSGSDAFFRWRENCLPSLHDAAMTFLDAKEEGLAFPPNFSYALQGVISGISRDAKVCLIQDDYPSLTLPFHLGEYNIFNSNHVFDSSFQDLIEADLIEQSIEVVVLSHVQFKSGFTVDLPRLGAFCRKHGIASIVDCTQSLGAIPISLNLSQIDVLIASNYKWMNAGFGSGIVAGTNAFFEKYPSKFGGFGSYDMIDGKLAYAGGIRALEPGHQAYSSLSTLEVAIKEKLDLGVQNIWEHNADLDSLLNEGLKTLGIERLEKGTAPFQSSISVIKCHEQVANELKRRGIAHTWREGHLRIALHFYNLESDVVLFLNSLEDIISEELVPSSQLFPGRK